MAIFGFKKKEEVKKDEAPISKSAKTPAKKSTKKVEKVSATKVHATDSIVSNSVNSLIIKPRVTEKSGIASQGGVYTFEVQKNSTKPGIAQAINSLYKVNPIKIAIVNVPSKKVFIRGHKGVVSGFKKAIVTLKKGDKIDFV
jgi:large subunit ribosomal protein L23